MRTPDTRQPVGEQRERTVVQRTARAFQPLTDRTIFRTVFADARSFSQRSTQAQKRIEKRNEFARWDKVRQHLITYTPFFAALGIVADSISGVVSEALIALAPSVFGPLIAFLSPLAWPLAVALTAFTVIRWIVFFLKEKKRAEFEQVKIT
ncbi:MAG: hypothetical protein AAB573_04440 [Patescibacteria group bacterium]